MKELYLCVDWVFMDSDVITKLIGLEDNIDYNIIRIDWCIDDTLEEIGDTVNSFSKEFSTFINLWNNLTHDWISYRDSDYENRIRENLLTLITNSLNRLRMLTDYHSINDIQKRYSDIIDDLTVYNNLIIK